MSHVFLCMRVLCAVCAYEGLAVAFRRECSAWEGLLVQRAMAALASAPRGAPLARCRNEVRRGARRHAGVLLQLSSDEMLGGLRMHPNCPAALSAWFAREGGLVTTATTMAG
jgi:hypothetical protein